MGSWKSFKKIVGEGWRILCSAVAVCMIFYAIYNFAVSFKRMETNRTYEQVREMTRESSNRIKMKFSDMIWQLQAVAEELQEVEDIHDHRVLKKIEFARSLTIFDFVAVADEQGNSIDSSMQEINISSRNYFKEAMNGRIVVSEVMNSMMFEGDSVQIIAVPVQNGKKEVTGIVYGIFNSGTISEMLQELSIGDEENYVCILDSRGNYITHYDSQGNQNINTTLWEDMDLSKKEMKKTKEILNDFSEKKSGYFDFTLKEEKMMGYYMPMGISDWYVLSMTSERPVTVYTKQVNRQGFQMAVEITAACVMITVCLLGYYRNMNQKLVDVHEEVADNEEILRFAITQSGQIIFLYDISSETLEWRAAGQNVLPLEISSCMSPELLVSQKIVSEDSAEVFRKMFQRIHTEPEVCADVKFLEKEEYRWYHVIMRNMYKGSMIARTIGIIEDIHEQKIRELQLSDRANRDGLTGLYNAGAIKQQVEILLGKSVEPDSWHAFAILDLDNFKAVNDNLGHAMGDQVLMDVAETMRKKFRSSDLLGRIGGDEFVIVLKYIPDRQVIDLLFSDLVTKLEKTYEKDGVSIPVTASVGIALAPLHGQKFQELYEHADQALYQVKRARKNGYAVYETETF